MKTKVLLAALGGAVANFLLGWLVYGMLMMDYYEAHSTHYEGLMKEMPILWAIFLGGFISSLLMAWLFDKMGVSSWMAGLTNGAIISFMISLAYDTYFYASMNLYSGQLLVIDVVIGTVFGAIIGALVGFILGMGKKDAATA